MNSQSKIRADAEDAETVRPIGAWVVGIFLLVVCVAIWGLVALVFINRA